MLASQNELAPRKRSNEQKNYSQGVCASYSADFSIVDSGSARPVLGMVEACAFFMLKE